MEYLFETSEQLLFDYSVFQPRQDERSLLVENVAGALKDGYDGVEEGLDYRFDFDQEVPKADKLDYEVAAASGLLTALLDILWVEEFSYVEARKWGSEEVEKIVIEVAKKKTGFVPKGADDTEILQKAIQKLEKKYPIPADILTPDFGGGLQHHLRDFVHHPTILGLFFSILSQFTECGFGTDVDGKFRIYPIPKDKLSEELIGDTFRKKIAYGTINWAIHLISDLDGTSINPGKGTGIPGPILASLKELSSLPLVHNLQVKHEYKGEVKYKKISAMLQKVFDGTLFADHDEAGNIIKGTEKPLDFRTELGMTKGFVKSTIPVIANECIVRGFYFVRRLFDEIKRNDIKTLSDIAGLDPRKFLPHDSRALTRMLTVSSGTFMMVVTAKDAVAAAIKSKGDKKKFAAYFFLNINYVGIMRFTFACKNDAGYIAEDVKEEYRKFIAEKRRKTVEQNKEIPGLKSLMLDEMQARLLYSLQWRKVYYDIMMTEDYSLATEKRRWLDEWEQSVLIDFNKTDDYIIRSERLLYTHLKEKLRTEESRAWIYLVAMELDLFKPYYLLDVNQIIPKGLKLKSDYLSDEFCEKQNVVTEKDIKALRNEYAAAKADMTNKKVKTAIGATAALAATAASGGLAWAFAPEIAVALAGGSFAGLSGAALTSASLAAIGFGSLATGGLGMAGGTAIIAGGGTLLGMVGSGAMTLSAKAFLSSKGTVLNECAKLLTFCRGIMLEKYCDRETVAKIRGTVEKNIAAIEQIIEQAEAEEEKDGKQQKKMLNNAKTSLKYIRRCNDRMLDALDDKEMIALSDAVHKIRRENPRCLIWCRFEYKGQYIFIVSSGKPREVRNIAPGVICYSLDQKTLKFDYFSHAQFYFKDGDKIHKAMDKTIVLMDISQEEYRGSK